MYKSGISLILVRALDQHVETTPSLHGVPLFISETSAIPKNLKENVRDNM
jgi:hypothetical protein